MGNNICKGGCACLCCNCIPATHLGDKKFMYKKEPTTIKYCTKWEKKFGFNNKLNVKGCEELVEKNYKLGP